MEKGKYNILNFKLYYIIQGKNTTFSTFVVAATKYAINSLKEEGKID